MKQFVGIRVSKLSSGDGFVRGFGLTHSSCKSHFNHIRNTVVLGQAAPVAPSKVAPWELLKVPCYAKNLAASLLLLYQHAQVCYGDLLFFLNNCGHGLLDFKRMELMPKDAESTL